MAQFLKIKEKREYNRLVIATRK